MEKISLRKHRQGIFNNVLPFDSHMVMKKQENMYKGGKSENTATKPKSEVVQLF